MSKLGTGIVLCLLLAGMVHAAGAPDAINYQGVVRDDAGEPLTGSFDMTFRFYDAESGGSEVIVDEHLATGSGAVAADGGLFNVALGSGDVADGGGGGTYSTLGEAFGDFTDLWLQLEIDGEVLSPRVKVVAAAYALNASRLGGRDSSGFLDTSVAAQVKSGDLGVTGTLDAGSITSTGNITPAGRFFAPSFQAGTPGFSFTDDPLTGIYQPNVNAMGFATSGVGRMFIGQGSMLVNLPMTVDDVTADSLTTTGLLTSGSQVLAGDGTEASPAFTFASATNTGMFRKPGLSELAFSVGGTEAMAMRSGQVALAGDLAMGGRIIASDGTQASPSITFSGNEGTGLFETVDPTFTDDAIGVSFDGFEVLQLSKWYGAISQRGYAFYDEQFGAIGRLSYDGQFDFISTNSSMQVGTLVTPDAYLSAGLLLMPTDASLYYDTPQFRFELNRPVNISYNLVVGTFHDVNFNSFGWADPESGEISEAGDVYISDDLEVFKRAFLSRTLYMEGNPTGPEGNQSIFFFDNVSRTDEVIRWDDSVGNFYFSDDLDVAGVVNTGVSANVAQTFIEFEDVAPGDVVALAPRNTDSVRRATEDDGALVVGVVTDSAGIVLGGQFSDVAVLEQWGEAIRARFEGQREALEQEVRANDPFVVAMAERIAGARELEREIEGEEPESTGEAPRREPAETESELQREVEERALHRFAEENFAKVAIAGRVRVMVDAGYSPIRVGDPLAPSPIPGMARRADGAGLVIGTALEELVDGRGTVMMLVGKAGAYAPLQNEIAEVQNELDERTPDPETGTQVLEHDLQIVLDRGADDAARFSILRDGSEDGALADEIFRVDEQGNVYAKGSFQPNHMDVAEYFALSEPAAPGDLLVVDPDRPGRFRPARREADPGVVGIVSSGPGLLLGGGIDRIAAADPELAATLDESRRLGDRELEVATWQALVARFRETHAPVAMTGTVPCRVDAGFGAVRVGDLLTTSPTPGHAKRAQEAIPGTIVGKALEPLASGTGMIRVLVMSR